jgi:hypothetical protein
LQQLAGATECPRCGVVFGKWESSQPVPRRRRGPADGLILETVEDGRLGRQVAVLLASALAAALLVYFFPLTRFVLSTIVTLFHELGHTVASWLLGHPAIPAFDFVYGGGFTHEHAFQLPIALTIAGAMIWLGRIFRRNPRTLVFIAGIFGIWLLAVTADWRRELVIASAGHLGEIVLTGTFFYMTLANVGWRNPEVERSLGAFVAFFVQLNVINFAWRLGHDPSFLDWYLAGKGGALMNDLEVIALDLHIWIGISPSVEDLAGWLLLLALAPLPLAYLAYRFRRRVYRLTSMLLATEPSRG